MRSRDSAKLPIARAAMPMFSPSCGSTRTTTGPARSTPDLVLSVPEPDMSLHFLIQRLKNLNQVPKKLIQDLKAARFDCLCGKIFSSEITGLVAFFTGRLKPCGAAKGQQGRAIQPAGSGTVGAHRRQAWCCAPAAAPSR